MALVPRALNPAVTIRRRALYDGILGQSTVWRVVAVWVFGRSALKRLFGTNEEVLDVSRLGPGRFLSVETSEPITRRRARRLARAGTPVPTLAQLRATATLLAVAAAASRRKR